MSVSETKLVTKIVLVTMPVTRTVLVTMPVIMRATENVFGKVTMTKSS